MTGVSQMNDMKYDLNGQTAKIPWQELQRFFAQGRVWQVAEGADLVAVASAMADDDSAQVKIWQHEGVLGPVSDTQASEWISLDSQVWAVTVAPFVLVQTVSE